MITLTHGESMFYRAFREEVAAFMRSRWDLALLFLIPPAMLAIIAAMFVNGVVREIPVAVVDLDRSEFSRAAIRNMEASPTTKIVAMPSDLASAWSLLRSGNVYSVSYLPKGASAGVLRKPEAVIVYYNGAFQTVGTLAAKAQSQAIATAAAPLMAAALRDGGVPPLTLEAPAIHVNVVGNPQTSFELFLGSLIAPGVLHLLMACATVMALGRELRGASLKAWADRFEGRLLSALLGKLAPYIVIFTMWGLAWIAWLAGWRGWGIAGSPLVLGLGIVGLMSATAGISAFLVALTGDTDTSYSASAIYAGSAIAFSNGTLPLTNASTFVQAWSNTLPFTHYLRVQNAHLVMGAERSASTGDLWALAGVAALGLVGGWLLARRRSQRSPVAEPLAFDLPPNCLGGAFVCTLRSIAKTRAVASVLVLAVVAYAFYYPLAYAGQTAVKLPIMVVDQDQSPLSRKLTSALDSTRAIEARTVSLDHTGAQQALRNGDVDGVILIPKGFEARLKSGAPHGVAVDLDGAHLVRASAVGEALSEAIASVIKDSVAPVERATRLSERIPRVVQRPLYNTSEGYGSYAVPAVSAIILQQTLLLGAALISAIRRESGAVPLTLRGFGGLWLALILIGVLGNLFYFGFVFWFQDYPRMGNPTGALLVAPLFAAAASGAGLALGTLFERHERVMQILVGSSVPLFFLGGAAWPHFMMPDTLAALAHASPATPAIQAFVKFNSAGASLSEAGNHLMNLAILAALYGVLAWWLVRREPDEGAVAATDGARKIADED